MVQPKDSAPGQQTLDVLTCVDETGRLHIDLQSTFDDVTRKISGQVFDHMEQRIREHLISLGWLPPDHTQQVAHHFYDQGLVNGAGQYARSSKGVELTVFSEVWAAYLAGDGPPLAEQRDPEKLLQRVAYLIAGPRIRHAFYSAGQWQEIQETGWKLLTRQEQASTLATARAIMHLLGLPTP